MAVPTETPVHNGNPYGPPAISGLFDLLDQHARDRPDARALLVGSDRIPICYGELAALVDDVANRLDSSGLRRGDAVGLVGANNADFVVALLGAARAGLVVAPLDPALPRSELTTRLGRLGAQALLAGRPALGAEPVAPLGIPTWNLEVDVAADTTRPPRSTPNRAHSDAGSRNLDSPNVMRSSCSHRVAPPKRKWSR
jgi:acyl-CoA synthetase (AMP-forming)/AMP-acid ligase II